MIRFATLVLLVVTLVPAGPAIARMEGDTVVLDGRSTTALDIVAVSDGAKVAIDPEAMERVTASHDVLISAAKQGMKIYGLTVGVGLNKDQDMVDPSGGLAGEVVEASRRFNAGLVRAHCGGVGPDLEEPIVRAVMAARLASMLFGGTGVQPVVVRTYEAFLNAGISPAVPSVGSMGEADITILGHVGLAMMGEGEVYVDGRKRSAAGALAEAGIEPLVPFGKDALSILSSNAYSAGLAAIAIAEMRQLSRVSKIVYALSLEALNGNVAPFLADTARLRPFPHYVAAAQELRSLLAGSYLWEPHPERALQDPLSYRDSAYVLGEIDAAIARTSELMGIHWNSSDDNPGVAVGVRPPSDDGQVIRYYVQGEHTGTAGAVLPTANFEPLPWVIAFQSAGVALAHASHTAAQRTLKLAKPEFTTLSRFLGTERTVHAFGAMQKPFVALAAENRDLANPVSLDWFAVAGNIEDVATNAPRVVRRVRRQIDNLFHILGIELVHAAQAIDLRRQESPDLALAPATDHLHEEFREVVAFLEEDRPLTEDFRNAATFLRGYR